MLCQDLEWLSSFDFYVTFPGRDVSIPRVQIPNLHNREVGIRVSHIHTSSGLLSELEGTREMPDMVTDVPGHSVSDCKSVSNFLLPSFHKAWHPHCNRTSASTCSFGGVTHLLKPSNTIFYVIVMTIVTAFGLEVLTMAPWESSKKMCIMKKCRHRFKNIWSYINSYFHPIFLVLHVGHTARKPTCFFVVYVQSMFIHCITCSQHRAQTWHSAALWGRRWARKASIFINFLGGQENNLWRCFYFPKSVNFGK